MKIIIGLGNPGAEYENTRHNIGFEVVDSFKAALDFENYSYQNNYDAWISKGTNASEKIILVKPDTFMNNSGKAVQKIMSFYKLTPDDIIVVHDDLDIGVGNYKISRNVSSAGHNGIADIIEKIGTQDFTRVRVGVETAEGRANRQIPGEDFVLQKFSEEEREKIKTILPDVLHELKKLL